LGTASAGRSRSGRLNCRWGNFVGGFVGFLLKRCLQRSLIAISRKSQGGEQIAKFIERLDRHQGRAE